MNIDINCCFAKDVNENFEPRLYPEQYKKDPDRHSEKLYEVLFAVYNQRTGNKLGKTYKRSGCYFKNLQGIRYSSDYIGPSNTQAKKWGIDNELIGEAIEKCRTIGGHIIWPRHNGGINQAKARVCDRIDITLLELKNFYDKHTSVEVAYSNGLRSAFIRDREWIESFGTFKEFVDANLLKGSFVDEEYNVIELAEIKGSISRKGGIKYIPSTKEKYLQFMENLIVAINKRNEVIQNEMEKQV